MTDHRWRISVDRETCIGSGTRTGTAAAHFTLVDGYSGPVAESADPDEFSDFQLIGLAAVNPDGQRLGEVVRVDHGPAADLLVLRLPDGREALVPFVKAIVPEVDVAGGRLVLTPPGGLLEL